MEEKKKKIGTKQFNLFLNSSVFRISGQISALTNMQLINLRELLHN